MSDTPESDSAERMAFANEYMVPTEVARRLECERDEAREVFISSKRARASLSKACDSLQKELRETKRERDEAREAAAKWESSSDAMERAGAEQARRADENREWALRAERERDEAWACCDELVVDSNAITLAKTVMRLERERDEAREQLAAAKHFLEKYIAERDEARVERNENRFLLKTALCALDEIDLAAGKFVNSKGKFRLK